jgi:hypothetical protein
MMDRWATVTDLRENPFFIVGSPRSGTTLLRFIISSHPRIFVPAETGFIPHLGYERDSEMSLTEVQRVLARIGKVNGEWSGLVKDVNAFYQTLPEPQLAHVLYALYHERMGGSGAGRWGDKTPSYVLHLPMLSSIFPTAQFIHVIRDGRDATLSAHKKWGAQRWYMDQYYLMRNWVLHVEQGRTAGRRLRTSRYLEVRYEALVAEPEPVLGEICAFLGEDLHPAMLDHTALARRQIRPGGHIEVRQPISTGSVGRWKTEMSEFYRKVADQVAGPTLSSLGYELSELPGLSGSERLRLRALSTKFAVTHLGRQTLMRLGLLTLNRGKRQRI